MLSPQYVAGLFDGEGTVSLIYSKLRQWSSDPTKHVHGFKFVVGLSNTHEPIVKMLKDQFEGDINPGQRHFKYKTVWSWKLCSARTQLVFLEAIRPCCIIKSRHVDLGLKYLETCVPPGHRLPADSWTVRLKILEELKVLNQRGAIKASKNAAPQSPTMDWNPKIRAAS